MKRLIIPIIFIVLLAAAPAGANVSALPVCSSAVHDAYGAAWHPQINGANGCRFTHEHGSNPALLAPGAAARPFGQVAAQMAMPEPHPGFKHFVFDDQAGHRWLITAHLGTSSTNRACVRYHEVAIKVVDTQTLELLADLDFMADFGKAVSNRNHVPLTPPACPTQGNLPNPSGVREIPVASEGPPIGYEPWRVNGAGLVIPLTTASLTFNTKGTATACNTITCTAAIATGANGVFRTVGYGAGFGVQATGAISGTFYTDGHGLALLNENDLGAVRQYIKPGLSISLPARGYEPWDTGAMWYQVNSPPTQTGPFQQLYFEGPN